MQHIEKQTHRQGSILTWQGMINCTVRVNNTHGVTVNLRYITTPHRYDAEQQLMLTRLPSQLCYPAGS